MTRLYDATHGQVQEFVKKLSIVGFTAEHMRHLMRSPHAMERWVRALDVIMADDTKPDPDPATGRVRIEHAFSKGRLQHLLLRMGFVYLDEITECTEGDFLDQRGFGAGSLKQVVETLEQYGLRLSNADRYSLSIVFRHPYDGNGFYRPNVGKVPIWQLLDLKYTYDTVGGVTTIGNITLQGFRDMSETERESIFTPHGIQKIESFIQTNQL